MEIDLRPIGEIDYDLLQGLKTGLNGTFGCPVNILDSLPVPGESFVPERNQYLSDNIIAALCLSQSANRHILGITDVNIFTLGLNFVFGQADPNSRVAIISLNLLRQENYGFPADKELLKERALKEAIHELGHTFGLGHCPDGNCVMHFSNSLIDTDIKKPYYCCRCQPKLIL